MSPAADLTIHLGKLPHLAELFSLLNSGKHLNRLADHGLWAELEREQNQYVALFKALGYSLCLDGRGFAWFQIAETSSSNVSKATRNLALFFMLLFEHQADNGKQLGRFADWLIDRDLLGALWEKNKPLLEAEEFSDLEQWLKLLNTACTYGFVQEDNGRWRLLAAVYRYLDRFVELAEKTAKEDELDGSDEEPDEDGSA